MQEETPEVVTVVGVVASPQPGGRTATAVAAVLSGAASYGASTQLVELSACDTAHAIALVDAADAVVLGSPVYRATYSALLKDLLEKTERGRHGEQMAPLRAKAAAIVMTGASAHHFLATDQLRCVLSTFFAAQTLAPSLYFDHGAFAVTKELSEKWSRLAQAHGRALTELAAAIGGSTTLRTMEPLV